MMAQLHQIMILLSFFSYGGSFFAAPSKASVVYKFVTSLNPEEHSGTYFKKAHQAIVSSAPQADIEEHQSFWQFLIVFCMGLAAAFFAGMLLLFTPYGILALVFALGVLYHYRNRSFKTLIYNGFLFVSTFIPVYVILHMFLPQIDIFLENPQIHFWFSIFFIFLVSLASFSLLGVIQFRTTRLIFKEDDQRIVDGCVIAFSGLVSALMLLTQKTSILFMMARQFNVGAATSGSFLLSFMVALGIGSMILVNWILASYFMKDEYVDLWVVDLLSVLAWFSLYKSIIVMRPYMFSWHYNLLLSVLTFCAGVYYWMSVRMEITYQYIDYYSKAPRIDNFLHIFGGVKFLNGRILFKRLVAVIAFLAMGSFLVKTYLFYERITLKQAIFRVLKSL